MTASRRVATAAAVAIGLGASIGVAAALRGGSSQEGAERATTEPARRATTSPAEPSTTRRGERDPVQSVPTGTAGPEIIVSGPPGTDPVTPPVERPTTTFATETTAAETVPAVTGVPRTVPRITPTGQRLAEWIDVADRLGPLRLPTECPFPADVSLLPNATRSYRGGTHEGVDFGCPARGHDAVAALAGRVVFVNDTFVDAEQADRDALLREAKELGETPPWTLAFLYGRFVVVDHGIVAGVGHVVTISAHLEEVDPGLRLGRRILAGTRLGEIGNRGTDSGAEGDGGQVHLHWELRIDDTFLGRGLGLDATAVLYRHLFGLDS